MTAIVAAAAYHYLNYFSQVQYQVTFTDTGTAQNLAASEAGVFQNPPPTLRLSAGVAISSAAATKKASKCC